MEPFAATDKALRIPDLLTSVLRCVGPLSWLKCASVCSVWSHAILARDEEEKEDGQDEARTTRRRAGTRKASAPKTAESATATAAAPPPPATSEANEASPSPTVAAAEVSSAGATTETSASAGIRSEDGKGAGNAPAITADLWREFAVTVIRYGERSTSRGAGNKASSDRRGVVGVGGSCGGGGGRGGARGGSNFYRDVCLEGDPTVLGPPLRATTAVGGGTTACRGEVKVVTVSLTDLVAASEARYRRPRWVNSQVGVE